LRSFSFFSNTSIIIIFKQINHQILYNLQDVFNLLPGLHVPETKQAFVSQNNDTMLVMYISSLVRSIIALHNLINNKIDLRSEEQQQINKIKQAKKDKKKDEAAADAAKGDAAKADDKKDDKMQE